MRCALFSRTVSISGLALVLPAAALVAVAAAPAATAAPAGTTAGPCFGTVTGTRVSDGEYLGAIEKEPSFFGQAYGLTTVADDAETLTFVGSDDDDLFDVTTASKPDGLEYLGVFPNTNNADIGPGSENAALLTYGDQTPHGSTPSTDASNGVGGNVRYESAVFTLTSDLQVGIRWVNVDGTAVDTATVLVPSSTGGIVGGAGDLAVATENLGATAITLTLNPGPGADCTQRNIPCEDATAALDAATADLKKAERKVEAAKVALAKARKSGNPVRIKKAKQRLAQAKQRAKRAGAGVADAQAQVDQDC